eukprot:jgi/Tetstr1/443021/TSEL_031081.t1
MSTARGADRQERAPVGGRPKRKRRRTAAGKAPPAALPRGERLERSTRGESPSLSTLLADPPAPACLKSCGLRLAALWHHRRSASPARAGRRGHSSGRRVCSGRDAEGRGALRVRFAGGPLGGVYGTDDGHPPEEGRVATAKRDLGGGGPEGFTWHNVRALAKLLGDDCLPSIERLKRRLKVMEAGDSPAKASNKAGERGKAAAAPKGRHSSMKRAKS